MVTLVTLNAGSKERVSNSQPHPSGVAVFLYSIDMTKDIVAFFGFVGLSQLAGVIGSFFTISSVSNWYITLERPLLSPPDWVFGPVWITLYTLMGVAVWLVWRQRYLQNGVKAALVLFGIQLILNSLWSIIFFGWQEIGYAFVEIILLWVAIFLTIKQFAKIAKIAAWLMVPYLLWVSFAAYLNLGFLLLN